MDFLTSPSVVNMIQSVSGIVTIITPIVIIAVFIIRRKAHIPWRFIFSGIALSVISILIFVLIWPYATMIPSFIARFSSCKVPVNDAGLGVTSSQRGDECIGVSDGRFVFDLSNSPSVEEGQLNSKEQKQRVDERKLKQDAANAYLNDNISEAQGKWEDALRLDPTDAEAQIYAENLRAMHRPDAKILIVSAMLTGQYMSDGRDVLQGVYVEQYENNRCSTCVPIVIYIANLGSDETHLAANAQKLARQINTIKEQKSVVGIIDGLSSLGTIALYQGLQPPLLPIVASKASSDDLDAYDHFFRVVPDNHIEATYAAMYAKELLDNQDTNTNQNGTGEPSTVAILRPNNNSFASTLDVDFHNAFQNSGHSIVDDETFDNTDPKTIETNLAQIIPQLRKDNPDLIFCSCYASDASALLRVLTQQRYFTNGHNQPLLILGGDAFYELGDYHNSPEELMRLRFVAFSYPDIWSILAPNNQPPMFFKDYKDIYNFDNRVPNGVYGHTRPTAEVMVAFDAAMTLMKACELVSGQKGPQISSEDVYNALKNISGSNAIQGVTGRISFKGGNPEHKVMVIVSIDGNSHLQMVEGAKKRIEALGDQFLV